MSTETNANTKFTEQPAQLYDPSSGKVVAQKAYNVAHDTATDIWYGDSAITVIAATGAVALWGTNPATTGVATDIAIKWGGSGTTQVNHVQICNNTTININYELDAATTLGSDILAPGQKLFLDIQTTAVHLQAASSQNVNGTSAGGIVVRGWL